MSQEERTLVDTSGEYCDAVRGGEPVPKPEWRSCRLVVTTDRLVLATGEGKRTVPHGKVELVDPEEWQVDVDAMSPDAGGAQPLRIGDHVVLVDAPDLGSFEREYCRATLHGEVILANTPAVLGGVVREESDWRKARFYLAEEAIELEFPDGDSVAFAVEDVGTIAADRSTVMGQARTVLEVGHTDDRDRSVETHLSGMDHHTRALQSLFETVIDERGGDYELSEDERQVIMALYSGVSPFEMADFVGLSVAEVEEIYRRLLEVGAVDEVRTRTEVTLNAEGRNMASEAMSEE